MKKWFIIVGSILLVVVLVLVLNKDSEKILTLEIDESSLYKSGITYKDGYRTILNLSEGSTAKVKAISNFKCDIAYDAEKDVIGVDDNGNIFPLEKGTTKLFAFCKENKVFSNYIEVVVE